MKAPDKIYLNRKHPEPYWFNDKQLDSDVEYICKDALIEWANNWERLRQSDEFLYGMELLVQHLNSM